MFHRLSKHLEFRQKYSAACRILNSLLGVWISRWNTFTRVWYICILFNPNCQPCSASVLEINSHHIFTNSSRSSFKRQNKVNVENGIPNLLPRHPRYKNAYSCEATKIWQMARQGNENVNSHRQWSFYWQMVISITKLFSAFVAFTDVQYFLFFCFNVL